MDKASFEYLDNWLMRHPYWRKFWIFWSVYAFIFLFILGFYILTKPNGWSVGVLAFSAFIIARFGVAKLVNIFYKKARPYQAYNLHPVFSRLFSWEYTDHNSFPSRHIISLAAIATIVFLFYPGIGLMIFGLMVMMGIGRIFFGYHYPSDAISGTILGIATALGVYFIAGFFMVSRLFTGSG